MLLTDDEYRNRYEELRKVKIELDPDPVKEGLQSINKKIAQVQGEKERTSALLIEAIKNRAEASILYDAKKGEHQRNLDVLLSSDEEVKGQKSAELRKATANVKLQQIVLDMAHTELDYQKADAYYKCVQQMYSHLESANMNISRQISVIQMGVQLREIGPEAARSLFGRDVHVK